MYTLYFYLLDYQAYSTYLNNIVFILYYRIILLNTILIQSYVTTSRLPIRPRDHLHFLNYIEIADSGHLDYHYTSVCLMFKQFREYYQILCYSMLFKTNFVIHFKNQTDIHIDCYPMKRQIN